MYPELSKEYLHSILEYDEHTGIFYNKIKRGIRNEAGEIAGTDNGYIQISINKKKYLAHRLAWLYVYGIVPKGNLDHIDNNPHNNAISNLREATYSQNNYNRRITSTSVSGYRGVVRTSSGNFSANIKDEGVSIYLGNYATPEEASFIYETRAKELQKEFYKDPGYTYSNVTPVHIKQKSKTGFTGVRPSGKRFKAVIKISGINMHLGTYDTPEEASLVFENKKKELGRK